LQHGAPDADRVRALVLQTPRLILRPHGLADFADCAALWADPEVTRFIGGRPSTEEEAWARLLRYGGLWSLLDLGFWAIRDRATGAYVGEAGFMQARRPLPPPFGDFPEVGWALHPAWQGKGYAREAMEAILAWGDANLDAAQSVCIIAPQNAASLGLAHHLGFAAFARAYYHGEAILLGRVRRRS
jgi:RimJ/RimL family protein N-acetyltransferase